MRIPNIKFLIEPKQDILVYFVFEKETKISHRGHIMEAYFFKNHPQLRILKKIKNKKKKEKLLSDYVVDYYRKHNAIMKKRVKEIKERWNKVKYQFFNLANKLFQNHPWPKGKYIAYVTIWGIYPRDIKEKIFFIPYKDKKLALEVIAHEMLHFIFYDYLYSHYPKYKKKRYQKKIWKISESFNATIQNQREWIAIFHKRPEVYPALKKLTQKIKKIWREKKDIDYLLRKILPRK